MYVRVQLSLRVRNPYIHVGRSFLKVISARSLLPRTKENYGFLCSTAWGPRRSRPVSCTSLRAVERDNTLINAESRKWDSVGVWFCPNLEFRACVEASYALELSTPSLWEIGLAQICYHRITCPLKMEHFDPCPMPRSAQICPDLVGLRDCADRALGLYSERSQSCPDPRSCWCQVIEDLGTWDEVTGSYMIL